MLRFFCYILGNVTTYAFDDDAMMFASHRKLPGSLKLPPPRTSDLTKPLDATNESNDVVLVSTSPKMVLAAVTISFVLSFPTNISHQGRGDVGNSTEKSRAAKRIELLAY